MREGDRDEDGIDIAANALVLSGGTITAVDGTTDADLRHDALAGGHDRKVDGSLITPPGVSDIYFVSSPARGDTYELGEMIELFVEFDRVVAVTGSPRVALTIGAHTRYAAYFAWSSGEDRYLHFSYAVQERDRDERGIGIPANALELGRRNHHVRRRHHRSRSDASGGGRRPGLQGERRRGHRPRGDCHLPRQPRSAADRRHLRSR